MSAQLEAIGFNVKDGYLGARAHASHVPLAIPSSDLACVCWLLTRMRVRSVRLYRRLHMCTCNGSV